MGIYSLRGLVEAAATKLHTFDQEKPDLVPTGWAYFDAVVGGVDPGSANLLLADQHVGKTHTILHCARRAPATTGIVSLEDGEVTLGAREIARISGIDPLRLRRKEFSKHELVLLRKYLDSEDANKGPQIAVCVGAAASQVYEAISALAEGGCKLIWVDYAQKMRGIRNDRNNEVSEFFTSCHAAAAKHGAAMFMASQVTSVEVFRHPSPWNARESRDLANEARTIVSMRQPEAGSPMREYLVHKCSFGAVEQPYFRLQFDSAGSLTEVINSEETF